MNTVTYRNEVLSEFRNNLLIEAMPEPREPEQAANDLMIFPEYHDSDRKRSTAQRRILTQNIARIHHPLLREVEELTTCRRLPSSHLWLFHPGYFRNR